MIITIIGIFAAVFTTSASLPQLFKTIKTKKTRDLSIITIIMLILGISCWFAYGIFVKDNTIILANLFGLIIQTIMLTFKIIYK